ncbi:hypothetical protein EV368DRAFT_69349 [Lentinula lateritia]|nr:hypothetical protein EV368DRAFT_69349 [Lentinula lateritia]
MPWASRGLMPGCLRGNLIFARGGCVPVEFTENSSARPLGRNISLEANDFVSEQLGRPGKRPQIDNSDVSSPGDRRRLKVSDMYMGRIVGDGSLPFAVTNDSIPAFPRVLDYPAAAAAQPAQQKENRLAHARKFFAYGSGPVSGSNIVIEDIADIEDDEEDYGEYQADRLDDVQKVDI